MKHIPSQPKPFHLLYESIIWLKYFVSSSGYNRQSTIRCTNKYLQLTQSINAYSFGLNSTAPAPIPCGHKRCEFKLMKTKPFEKSIQLMPSHCIKSTTPNKCWCNFIVNINFHWHYYFIRSPTPIKASRYLISITRWVACRCGKTVIVAEGWRIVNILFGHGLSTHRIAMLSNVTFDYCGWCHLWHACLIIRLREIIYKT